MILLSTLSIHSDQGICSIKMGVYDQFKRFCTDIKISGELTQNVTQRYKRITKTLNADFWQSSSDTLHSLYVGSYGRDTDIHVSDIDMLFEMPGHYFLQYNNYQGNGQSALLQRVKSSIEKTYPTSYIRADGQVIVVNFSSSIRFEVLPCFSTVSGNKFLYPDTNGGGSWKVTDPRPEIAAIQQANNSWNKNLKNLCRMCRSWKENCNVKISGILIDTFAFNFLKRPFNREVQQRL